MRPNAEMGFLSVFINQNVCDGWKSIHMYLHISEHIKKLFFLKLFPLPCQNFLFACQFIRGDLTALEIECSTLNVKRVMILRKYYVII